MLHQQSDSIHYYTFASFQDDRRLFHAVLTRHGGFSEGPWRSLNLGGSVGDDPERVRRNKRHALLTLGLQPETLVDVWQVHSAEVFFAVEPRPDHVAPSQADILLTDRKNLTLLMRFADCVPILLYDPCRQVIGLVHAGWQGTVKGAARAAVEAMCAHYGSRPSNILAGIGPSIGPDHYPVGVEVVDQVRRAFGTAAASLFQEQNGAAHLDLWAANEWLLRQAGVEQIERADLCTACHKEDFFSHRADKGRTGRFGVLMELRA